MFIWEYLRYLLIGLVYLRYLFDPFWSFLWYFWIFCGSFLDMFWFVLCQSSVKNGADLTVSWAIQCKLELSEWTQKAGGPAASGNQKPNHDVLDVTCPFGLGELSKIKTAQGCATCLLWNVFSMSSAGFHPSLKSMTVKGLLQAKERW